MRIASHRITFGNVLLLLGLIYFSLFFLRGQTLFEVPNSWFLTWMANIFQKMDTAGFFNVWSGQTQGTHYLYFLIWKPSQFLAGSQSYFALTFSMLWLLISVGTVFLSAYLFYKIVEHLWGEEKGVILGTMYVLIFLTLPEWYTFIDSIAIAGMLAAIYLSFKGSTRAGGLILGITATVKPMGLLILPVMLKSEFLSRKDRITMLVAALASFGALLLPFAISNFQIFISSIHWQSGRPPWETVYALAGWLLNMPYSPDAIFLDYSGSMPRDWGWTGITPSPTMMTTVVPNYNPWYNSIFTVLMLGGILVFLVFKRVPDKKDLPAAALCMLAMYFGFFYGWSLQFFLWLIPFLLIGFPLIMSIGFRLAVMLEYPFFFALYMAKTAPDLVTAAPGLTVGITSTLAPAGVAGYWAIIIVRTGITLAIAALAWRRLPVQVWNPGWKRDTGAGFLSRLIPVGNNK